VTDSTLADEHLSDGVPLWMPSSQSISETLIDRFRRRLGLVDTSELSEWSVSSPNEFWTECWAEVGLGPAPDGPAVELGERLRDARFFPAARLNAAEVILAGREAAADAEMLISRDELGRRDVWTRRAVRNEVAAVAAALRGNGVSVGDRVAAWMPNIAETIVVMLAATSIGAVFSSTSPDFGADGVLDRFGQIEPVVLVAAASYCYGGKVIDCIDRLDEIAAGLPSLRRIVVCGNTAPEEWVDQIGSIEKAVTWDDWIGSHRDAELTFEQLPFDHPWTILYSSGTTGVPKCIVHRAGGVLLQHLKEHQFHNDIRPGDRVMYYTTCGWMMWNWLASVPASGATAVLYDGSPFHPGPSTLFALATEERLTFLGVSAKFIDSVAKSGYRPVDHHDLSELRTMASTGSPLSAEAFRWVYEAVAPDIHLASISGGTDLCGCFVGGDPTRPVFAGEIQGRALGMAVDVWTDAATSSPPGARGELVCTQPFPSMPLQFFGDDGTRYDAAYFERFDGVWAQGDFASWTPAGGIVIHGRSDTTLNPGGVRIGTAEIYRQVEQIPSVIESLVFGQEFDGDVRIVLLVRLADGDVLTDELVAEIRARIRTGCTPRHVPARVIAVEDLPRTRSGKLAELAVSDIVNGRPVRNTTALANPESLEAIAAAQELRT